MTQLIEPAVSECSHHWLIEAPNGPTSLGTCQGCGEERAFCNSIQITSWDSVGRNAAKNRASN